MSTVRRGCGCAKPKPSKQIVPSRLGTTRVALGDVQNTFITPAMCRERAKSAGDYYSECNTVAFITDDDITVQQNVHTINNTGRGFAVTNNSTAFKKNLPTMGRNVSSCRSNTTAGSGNRSHMALLAGNSSVSRNNIINSTMADESSNMSFDDSFESAYSTIRPMSNSSRFSTAINSTVMKSSRHSLGVTVEQSRRKSTSSMCANSTVYTPIAPSKLSNANVLLRENTLLRKEPKLRSKLERKRLNDIEFEYSYEYLEHIYTALLVDELNILIAPEKADRLQSQAVVRAGIVNWLLKVQKFISFEESVFYKAVRLFDFTIVKIDVPQNMLQLLIITTLWITMKINNGKSVKVSMLLSMCNNSFSKQQLLAMERKVLTVNKFKVTTIDPTLFINYYLMKLQIVQEKLAKIGVLYILDCLAVEWDFSYLKLSTLCLSAINYSLCQLNDKEQNYFSGVLRLEEMEGMDTFKKRISQAMEHMADKNYIFKEPYFKYCELNMCKISKLIL